MTNDMTSRHVREVNLGKRFLGVDRRRFLTAVLPFASSLLTHSAAAGVEPAGRTLLSRDGHRRRALFVYGGWAPHEPELCRDRFVPWLESKGFDVVVSNSLDAYADETLMRSLDLIVQNWTMGKISRPQLLGLVTAVRDRSVGLAGWHGGLADSFRDQPEYEYMIGGNWVAHPGGDVRYNVKIVDHQDPVTAGVKDFKIDTEQYLMHVNPNNHVLATTSFDGRHDPWTAGYTMPVVWKRLHGRGRIFFSALGHKNAVFDTYEAAEIMRRGIRWAAGSRHATSPATGSHH